jgi:hypothetical protein
VIAPVPLGPAADHEAVVALLATDLKELLKLIQDKPLLLKHLFCLRILQEVVHVRTQPRGSPGTAPLHYRSKKGAEVQVKDSKLLLCGRSDREVSIVDANEAGQILMHFRMDSAVFCLHMLGPGIRTLAMHKFGFTATFCARKTLKPRLSTQQQVNKEQNVYKVGLCCSE